MRLKLMALLVLAALTVPVVADEVDAPRDNVMGGAPRDDVVSDTPRDDMMEIVGGENMTSGDWFNAGNVYYFDGKYDEALQCFDEAIRLDPNLTEAWYNRGIVLNDLGRHYEAFTAFDECTRLNRLNTDAWYNKGNALCHLGKYSEAINAYYQVTWLEPGYENAWFNLGVAYYQLQKYRESFDAFDRVVSLNPGRTDAIENRELARRSYRETVDAPIVGGYIIPPASSYRGGQLYISKGLVEQSAETGLPIKAY